MAIITLARQVGSGGQSIASALVERLGYRQYGRRELRQLAQRSGLALPESFERFANEDAFQAAGRDPLAHLHVSYGELEFDHALRGHGPSPDEDPEPSFLDGLTRHRRDILLSLLGVVYQLAAADNAILVGAGGQLVLAETPGVLRVKIVAPVEVRIQRLAAAYGLTPTSARAAVLHADQEQRDYNRAVLGVDWEDPLMWDIVANTERLTVEEVCALIGALIEGPQITADLEPAVKRVLTAAAAINRAFWADAELRSTTIMATPTANGLALRGEAVSDWARQRALALAAATAPAITILDDMPLLTRPPLISSAFRTTPEIDAPPSPS
jgi:cytidylate kinase